MTSRERMLRCLAFLPTDRVPRDLWSLATVRMYRPEEHKAMLEKYPNDLFRAENILGIGDRQSGKELVKGTRVDSWGCVWTAAEDGVIGEVKQPPLIDEAAVDTYQPPWEVLDRGNWQNVSCVQEQNLASGNPRFLLGPTSVRPFERMQFLRGSENLYMDLAYGTARVRALRDMVHEFYLRELREWCKTPADGLMFMDDWGSQRSLLISPDMWRDFFRPLYKDYCDIMRAAGKKIFFHCDGYVGEIFGDLIDLGMDAINSQLFIMDLEGLAEKYRGKVTFWGEIDRQHVLPGSPQDVRQAVARVRRALDRGRGGVIAQLEWGTTVPAANIEAALEAWL